MSTVKSDSGTIVIELNPAEFIELYMLLDIADINHALPITLHELNKQLGETNP